MNLPDLPVCAVCQKNIIVSRGFTGATVCHDCDRGVTDSFDRWIARSNDNRDAARLCFALEGHAGVRKFRDKVIGKELING